MPTRSLITALILLTTVPMAEAQQAPRPKPRTPPSSAREGGSLYRDLQMNLSPLGGRVYQSSGTADEFRSRNLLVTNEVVGGRGFRGSVGYTGESDFRGISGSDDISSFLSRSALSSVALAQYGSTYQRFSLGQEIGLLEYRNPSSAASGRDLADQSRLQALGASIPMTGAIRTADLVERRLQLDQLSDEASSPNLLRWSTEPLPAGLRVDADQNRYSVSLSSLRGVTVQSQLTDLSQAGINLYDTIQIQRDLQLNKRDVVVGQKFDRPYSGLVGGTDDETKPVSGEIGRPGAERITELTTMRSEEEYSRIQKSVAERFQKETQGTRSTDQPSEKPAEKPTEGPEHAYRELDRDLAALRRLLGEAAAPEVDAPQVPGTEPPERVAPAPKIDERIGRALQHGERVERLAGGEDSRFDELMRNAEDQLRTGEYFRAQQSFTRALRFIPGHPLATVGLAHAQLGSGLYLSSALTLRSLFTHQPEMIDAAFDPGLMPNRPRLDRAMETLRTRFESDRDAASSGFLFAYIGHLLTDQALMEEGIAVIEKSAPDDAIALLLRRVWLARDGQGSENPPSGGGGS